MKNNPFDDFYVFDSGIEFAALHQYIKEYPVNVEDKVFYAFNLTNGSEKPKKPIIFAHSRGNRPKDIISANPPIRLVSDKFLNVLKENKFTGWSTFPVKIHNKKGEEIHGYRGLAVIGRCGPVDDSKNKPIQVPARGRYGSYKARYGYYFDPASWDGNDIFLAKGTGVVFITKRVKEALEDASLSNLELTENRKFERVGS